MTAKKWSFNSKDERHPEDYYATDSRAIKPLFETLGLLTGGKLILENSCGEGHLSIPMQEMGHTVVSTDLVDRGFGIGGIDFLKDTYFHTLKYDLIVMNPPFKHAQEFIERSLKLAPVVCCFLRLTFLESQKRYLFFKENPPSKILVFSDRVPSAINADFENINHSAIAYCWIVWEKDFNGKTELDWIRL